MLLVGLFAPGEECSAAAALGMLYYFILAHQPNFDVVWCRGTVGEMIFQPWINKIEELGGKVLTNQRVTDIEINQEGTATAVICGEKYFTADAIISGISISGMKKIVNQSQNLSNYPEFRNLMNLRSIDVLAVRLWFDRRVNIPLPSNACFGFDETTGWTFFDLNHLHDQYQDTESSVVEVDFYHANQLLSMSDEEIINKVHRDLTTCIADFGEANIIDSSVVRIPQGVTHFAPGSYQHLLKVNTAIPNFFMSGDWIITNHGSWSQEKAYVTGLEAANQVMNYFSQGKPAQIIPVEKDELHIEIARTINQNIRTLTKNLFPDFWLP
jgi:uncharacterized protein with NAD-binding domain and iron-sulfur cluster